MAGTICSGVKVTLAPLRMVASSQAARSCRPSSAEELHPHPVPAAASEQCLGRSHMRAIAWGVLPVSSDRISPDTRNGRFHPGETAGVRLMVTA